jgi:hypothetical protein
VLGEYFMRVAADNELFFQPVVLYVSADEFQTRIFYVGINQHDYVRHVNNRHQAGNDGVFFVVKPQKTDFYRLAERQK